MKKSFNVVIATAGRTTLQRMVDSIAPQLEEQDYLTIIWDCQPMALQIDSNCQVITLHNPEPLGFWGHGSRNRWIPELPGDYFMNGDDDDIYTEGCMDKIRSVVKDHKLYMFQLEHSGFIIPKEKVVKVGNCGTPCGVYPKVNPMPKWEHVYGGDGMFYEKLSTILDVEFVGHIIYKVFSRDRSEVIPDKPGAIYCDCGFTCSITFNQFLKTWEGYCNRCSKVIR